MKPMLQRKITLIDGQYAARVQVDDVSQAHAQISRDVAFSCDTVDGSWTVLATHPYVRDLERADLCLFGSGCIHVTDPTICAFLEALCTLIAAPDFYGPGRTLRVPEDTA